MANRNRDTHTTCIHKAGPSCGFTYARTHGGGKNASSRHPPHDIDNERKAKSVNNKRRKHAHAHMRDTAVESQGFLSAAMDTHKQATKTAYQTAQLFAFVCFLLSVSISFAVGVYMPRSGNSSPRMRQSSSQFD